MFSGAFILPRREWSGKFRLVHKYIPKGVFLAGRPAAGHRAGKPGPEINR